MPPSARAGMHLTRWYGAYANRTRGERARRMAGTGKGPGSRRSEAGPARRHRRACGPVCGPARSPATSERARSATVRTRTQRSAGPEA